MSSRRVPVRMPTSDEYFVLKVTPYIPFALSFPLLKFCHSLNLAKLFPLGQYPVQEIKIEKKIPIKIP